MPKITPNTLHQYPKFLIFWRHYRRKVGKGEAVKAWIKNDCEPIGDDIIKAVKKYPFSDELKYVCHPSVWINQWRWLDQIEDDTNSGGDW